MSLPIIQPNRKTNTCKQMPFEAVVTTEQEVFFSAHSIKTSADYVRGDPNKLSNGSNISRNSPGVADSLRSYGNEDASLTSESTILVETEITEVPENVSLPKLPDDCVETDVVSVDSIPHRLSYPREASQNGEESHDEMPCHVKRPSAVHFNDSDSSEISEEESVDNGVEIFPVKPRAEKIGKQHSCYHCLKGNRLTEKEVCIVCDAKYCQNCTLRVMGSMPEGRKCIPCIGFRIDEQKRSKLGKCSRMLKRLLPELEVKRTMNLEMSCQANQLPPNLVYINDKPLDQEELHRLRSCTNPPKKLRPGYYWYDKITGLWGKQGQKPCQIISAHLNIGGTIKRAASNGNTEVLINGREITKDEVWMLKSAGILCEGKLSLWVGADGSCTEEGQNIVKGWIWEKTKTKVVCRMLSLPFPADSATSCGEEVARKKLEQKIDKRIVAFNQSLSPIHTLADIEQKCSEMANQFDVEKWTRCVVETTVGGHGWDEDTLRMREEEAAEWECIYGRENFGAAIEVGKRKVREMMELETEDFRVFGICGVGGSGKTTLARQVCRDDQVRSFFENRILFLTVSQSPNIDYLKARILGCLQYDWNIREKRTLVALDDVWSLSVLEQLIFPVPGCKTLVVSRFKFPVVKHSYEVEPLREHEATSLFCYSAFGQNSIPPAASEDLVKQIVNECKGLPLALKVIGDSLREQPGLYWTSSIERLSRGEMMCESHGSKLMERMAISVGYLEEVVRECFLDLGAFPEGTKIPFGILVYMWVELRNLNEEEALDVIHELSNKSLITLVKQPRAGEMYSTYMEVSVTQHDVLRDLALHLNNQENAIKCKRLLMPRRESALPRDWARNSDRPFNAQIVSVHTDEVNEMDWPGMEFPKAEVLILSFSSSSYFLPPFIGNMPRIRALIVINQSTSYAILRNFFVFNNLSNLRMLWLEKVCVPTLCETSIPLTKMRKVSLVLCKVNNSLDPSIVDLPHILPSLSRLTMDHCHDFLELPMSICRVHTLKSLNVTNCHSLQKLPADLHKLQSLKILRIHACPGLRMLPPDICELSLLTFLDISQCINLTSLPDGMGKLARLETFDMRECLQIRSIPESARSMQSLRRVVCDEEVSWLWKDVAKVMPRLLVQVAEHFFNHGRLGSDGGGGENEGGSENYR